MAEDTWYRVALPVLEYVHEHSGSRGMLSLGEISEGTGIGLNEVDVEVARLCSADYLAGSIHRMGGNAGNYLNPNNLGERGLRVVGAWPGEDPYEALVALLDRNIELTSDDEEKSKLKSLRASVTDVGKQVVAGLMVEFVKGNIHF
jgi:hypothetical protein